MSNVEWRVDRRDGRDKKDGRDGGRWTSATKRGQREGERKEPDHQIEIQKGGREPVTEAAGPAMSPSRPRFQFPGYLTGMSKRSWPSSVVLGAGAPVGGCAWTSN